MAAERGLLSAVADWSFLLSAQIRFILDKNRKKISFFFFNIYSTCTQTGVTIQKHAFDIKGFTGHAETTFLAGGGLTPPPRQGTCPNLGLVDSGTGGLLERNSFSIIITFTKMKIKS